MFKNTFFTEHFHVTNSDIWMQVVVIYNLNLSLQFCNDKLYTLLLQYRLNLYIDLFFGRLFLAMTARQSLKK